MQKCNKCGIEKPLTEFYFRTDTNNHTKMCKECTKHKQRNYYKEHFVERKQYYQEHKDYFKKYMKENGWKYKGTIQQYYENNKEKLRKRQRDYYQKHNEHIKQYNREYKEYKKKNNEVYRFKCNISSKLRLVFNQKGKGCHKKLEEITKLNDELLYEYLLKTFENNYGIKYNGDDVHIDHKIPLAKAITIEDVIKLNHYSNLQLLKPEDNMKKWKHITKEVIQ